MSSFLFKMLPTNCLQIIYIYIYMDLALNKPTKADMP